MHTPGIPYGSANFSRSLKTCSKNEFFIIETIRFTNKINELFLETNFKLFSLNKMRNKNKHLYLKMLLILSGDGNLSPGPVTIHQIKDRKFEVLTRNVLHFIHLNINSLVPKIDELRYIAKNSSSAVIGISKSKLDNTVYDPEVAIDGYIRNNICFNLKICLSNNIENIFIDLLFPKTKPITIGVIYKPPNQTRFLEQIITEFETLDLNDEHYVLGDFDKNIFSINRMNLDSSVRNIHRALKNILSFVRHTTLSS